MPTPTRQQIISALDASPDLARSIYDVLRRRFARVGSIEVGEAEDGSIVLRSSAGSAGTVVDVPLGPGDIVDIDDLP